MIVTPGNRRTESGLQPRSAPFSGHTHRSPPPGSVRRGSGPPTGPHRSGTARVRCGSPRAGPSRTAGRFEPMNGFRRWPATHHAPRQAGPGARCRPPVRARHPPRVPVRRSGRPG